MTKCILIKFPNKNWFEVSLYSVAENRADCIGTVEKFGRSSKEWNDEVKYVMDNPKEGIDWIKHNMDWDEIEEIVKFIDNEPYDYLDDFLKANFVVKEIKKD